MLRFKFFQKVTFSWKNLIGCSLLNFVTARIESAYHLAVPGSCSFSFRSTSTLHQSFMVNELERFFFNSDSRISSQAFLMFSMSISTVISLRVFPRPWIMDFAICNLSYSSRFIAVISSSLLATADFLIPFWNHPNHLLMYIYPYEPFEVSCEKFVRWWDKVH